MPYCQLTPRLDRCSVVLKTPLCFPYKFTRFSYEKRSGLVNLFDSRGLHKFQPRVLLHKCDSGIPSKEVAYSAELILTEVCSGNSSQNDTISVLHSTDNFPQIVDTHSESVEQGVTTEGSTPFLAEFLGKSCVSSRDTSSSNLLFSRSASEKTKHGLLPSFCVLFEESFSKKVPCPILGHSDVPCVQQFTVALRTFRVSQHCLEDISANCTSDGVLSLTWRIRLIAEGFTNLDLGLAILCESEQKVPLSQHRLLSLRCKRCRHVLVDVEGATVVPLPTEFFTSTKGSTFCEECEHQLSAKIPELARANNVIYQDAESVILFRPHSTTSSDHTLCCDHCGHKVGNFTDETFQFASYRKSCISGFYDNTDDIFWRHTPFREAIESLQYDKRTKLHIVVASDFSSSLSDRVDENPNAEHCGPSACLEIIKVTTRPDTFVSTRETIFEASQVLWRFVSDIDITSEIKWEQESFEQLVSLLDYFSRSPDTTTGYTPSLLVAI
ncbi:uncharacterized protein BXIN_0837 [Babesia sp. Xinjiang]|uniref:uncharacterized protein n=1 Tax=Babesia sp. Xinjiang TaxID=462227 RepID=UPI000A219AC1|nr:uncharacterized protein BXIN_0837 [Babesia sp. Xinjiang]ORM41289.1 hypothetical protein BXIN_0837 [Babesia sp. Xinjiang]